MPNPLTAEIPYEVESYPASFAEFMALPEGSRAQYIDGTVYVSPAPRPRHQDVVLRLALALQSYAADHDGYVGVAPFDVFVEPERALQPDVFYLAADRRDRISERGVEGPPTLVAEVLSPSTAYLDLSVKRRAYEESGIDELWILDPGERSAMVLTRQRPGRTGLARTAYVYESGPVASGVLAGFEVDAAALFARP